MYAVVIYDELGTKVVLMTFSSLRDAFRYARQFRISQRMSDDQVYIEYSHGGGSQLVGNVAQVGLSLQ